MSLNPSAPDQFSGADPHLIGFEEAKRDLLMADSVNERANAAFKLGLLGSTAGVAYLIAALYDNAANVRNAAAESLGQIGDASALGPLADLQQREGSNAVISNAINLISSREKNLVAAHGESADVEALESSPEDAATVNESMQLLKETQDVENFLPDALFEINNIFHAAAGQAERLNDARDRDSVTNSDADLVVSQSQPQQLANAITINDEIDAGFELLRHAEARQSELIAEAEARLHEQQESRQKIEVSVRQRAEQEKRLAEEIESLQVTEQELGQRLQEAEEQRRLQREAVKRTEEELRAFAEEENRRLAELEERRNHAEEERRKRAEHEQQLENSIALLAQTAAEQNERIAEAEAQIAETLRTLKADEERHAAEAQAAVKSQKEMRKQAAAKAKQLSKQAQRLSKEIEALQSDAEEQAKTIAATEAEVTRAQEGALAQSEVEARLREEVRRLQEAEAETRGIIEATETAVAELRSQVEAEERRLAELLEIKQQAEAEAKQRTAHEAEMKRQLKRLEQAEQQQGKRLRKAEASLQAKQEVLNQIEAELQRLTALEADLKQQLSSLVDHEQELTNRLQTAETALQSQQQTCNQLEAECLQRAEDEELHLATLAATREQAVEEGQRRAAQEAELNSELEALRATSQKQLEAISELEASLQRTQDEVQQHGARQSELRQQLSSLTEEEQKLRQQLQAAETSLQLQHETHKQLEIEFQRRAAAEEQLAKLVAIGEQAVEEELRRSLLEQQLSAELAALHAVEENQVKVIEKLELNVQQTRNEAAQLVAREAQLNAEMRTLQAKFAAHHASQSAVAARRVEQETLLREMDEAARLHDEEEAVRLGQLEALRIQLEFESQKRAEDERQLRLSIEALRVEETEHRARLEELREHANALEEAKQSRVLEECSLSAEIAAHQTEWLELSTAHEASASTGENLENLQHPEAELLAPVETQTEIEAFASEVISEVSEFEVISDEEPAAAELLVVSDSFSFEINAPTSNHEEEIIIGNADFEVPANMEQLGVSALEPVAVEEQAKSLSLVTGETGLAQVNDDSPLSQAASRLQSADPAVRCEALMNLSQLNEEESFDLIATRFDDPAVQVRNAAARALCELNPDRAASLTRALREAKPERRRRIGAAFAASGLASQAINCLAGEGRDVTYDAFTVLFLMAKAGEVQPLIETIENHANIAVRLAVIKLLAFSNQGSVVPAFRRLAVRASLPAEVRSAVMEAIHDISSPSRESRISAA